MVEKRTHKIILPTQEMPKAWLNPTPILAKMKKEPPKPKNPEKADRVAEMEKYWAPSLLAIEKSDAAEIPIPTAVMNLLIWAGRPTPLQRAYRLEQALNTPAKIFYKREDIQYATTGKTNIAIPQAYYAAKDGFKRLVAGGGAQWGTAASIAARYQDLPLDVYMPRESLESKEPHRVVMNVNAATVHGSPSQDTEVGKQMAKEDPNGSIATAFSEAVEAASKNDGAAAIFGNFYNTPIVFQSIAGLEAAAQLKMAGVYPDVVIGSIEGFLGLALPFIADVADGRKTGTKFIVAGSKYVPSLTEGKIEFDYPDYAGLMPLYRFHTLGCKRTIPLIHAGELRYHGVSPILSTLVESGLVTPKMYGQTELYESGTIFCRNQGVIPSHEAQYAIKAAIDEALQAKSEGKEKVILFNLSGHTMLEHKGYLEYIIQKKLELP
ncbi:MAG: TrpB-like pyridoxal phosphate-dependent enzyme [Nitrososphaerales archaeon]